MAYKGLSEYQIGFPLFQVSKPSKFQMSSFYVSIGETHCKAGHTEYLFQMC